MEFSQKYLLKSLHQAGKSLSRYGDRLLDRRICVGVTGFSGSGKTTFITSLMHQLQHFQNATLPAFSPALKGRLIGVRRMPLDNEDIAAFPYDEGIKALSATPPAWPQATTGLSSALLEIRYRPAKSLLSFAGRTYHSLFVELRDYPGEWLLDLPMMHSNFRQWSLQCAHLYNSPLRTSCLADLHADLQSIDPLAPLDPNLRLQLQKRFNLFLLECRKAGLTLIQPGHYLTHQQPTANGFFPLLSLASYTSEQLSKAHPDSYFKQLSRAYDDYVQLQVKPFFKLHFSQVDRQILLVDLLKALNGGPECLEDMRLALTRVLDCMHYGRSNLLNRLFQPKVDKVIVAATKIDQVLPDQHENIRALLGQIVHEAYRSATFELVDIYCEATASVRATRVSKHENRVMLLGALHNGRQGYMSHPDIPEHLPHDSEWQAFKDWQLPELQPPAGLQLQRGDSLHHIRLDSVIRELLGDKF